ncbi:MAG: hypothetical protein EOP85_05990 [Verrucomicrobiaceae bacterium]|nr:MAG: hypothetical protein EOP85_05990 [Verrucomicrobiaceae bacterium]
MTEEPVIRAIRAIGLRMRETMEAYLYGQNHAETEAEIMRLATEATEVSGYHDHIFQKCNVIRSHASDLHRPRKHKTSVREIMVPIDQLENWAPDDAVHHV